MGYPHVCSWSIFPSFAIIGDIGKSGAALKEFKAFKTDSNMDKARRTWDDEVSEWFIKHLQASVARAFRLLPFRPLRFLTGGWNISEGCPLSPCFPRLWAQIFRWIGPHGSSQIRVCGIECEQWCYPIIIPLLSHDSPYKTIPSWPCTKLAQLLPHLFHPWRSDDTDGSVRTISLSVGHYLIWDFTGAL